MNKHYSLIARAVERLDKSNGEARRMVYERARTAVAQLRSNQPALLDADITKECLALEEAIRQVEAEAARNSLRETRTEPRSPVPSGVHLQVGAQCKHVHRTCPHPAATRVCVHATTQGLRV